MSSETLPILSLICNSCFLRLLVGTFIPATFGKTRRGQLKLLYDGHAYTRDRQSAKTCNWKCSLFTRYRCRARAVTKDIGGFVHMKVTNTSHYHPKEEYKMKLKKEPL